MGIKKDFGTIEVSGADNARYFYSTYTTLNPPPPKPIDSKGKVLILGGGPNRIGQGIEFDYCCVHAAYALRDMGISTIMINCNPETVSTDYDTANNLYFEPLTVEDVMGIIDYEQPTGVIVQFGGQTPLNIADELKSLGVPILGTQPDIINTAEDRDLFRAMMQKLDIPMPESGMASTNKEALKVAKEIGYPVMVRPSYVLGGRGMEVVRNQAQLTAYMEKAHEEILIDRFLQSALECEADAISDGTSVYVPAILEHIEYTGVHSGDSACVIPTINLTAKERETIFEYTEKIARELGVVGLMNIQYAIEGGKVYVLEANPRASRTVPIVSKVCGIQMARIATEVMLKKAQGKATADVLNIKTPESFELFGVKESVFPFNMFHEVDPVLGPEMRSTGEVLGLSDNFGNAFCLAQEAAKCPLPDAPMSSDANSTKTILLSVSEEYLRHLLDIAGTFQSLGFTILATDKSYKQLNKLGIRCQLVHDVLQNGQQVSDLILDGTISMIINTPGTTLSQMGFDIRRAAVRKGIPMLTTIEAARIACLGMSVKQVKKDGVRSLQSYHLNA